jgi:hypothetical protein
VADPTDAIQVQLTRQVVHWTTAAADLRRLEDLAAPAAWAGLESYLGLALRRHLDGVVDHLEREGELLRTALAAADTPAMLRAVERRLLAFRRRYLRAEITLDFYADAVNTRTNPRLAGLLRACDTLAHRSMAQALDQLGISTPDVLCYPDGGRGAAILKVGLRLWDGSSESPAAAIKIARHNLLRPTALVHEAGHQVAHLVGWTAELAEALDAGLAGAPAGVAATWASWASEIAADAFAFAHTGYASVAALHDVVADEIDHVFRVVPDDPHPVAYLRVLLGVEMCRHFYGAGPWDDMAAAWRALHPLTDAGAGAEALVRSSLPLLETVVRLALDAPAQAFGGRRLSDLVPPLRNRPDALAALEHRLGEALFTSMHWIWTEALRLMALTGLRLATEPERAQEHLHTQEAWMLRLGGALQAA